MNSIFLFIFQFFYLFFSFYPSLVIANPQDGCFDKGKYTRQLGIGETWLALLHDKAYGTAQTTTMIDIDGEIDRSTFLDALSYLSQRYPLLCSRILLTDEGYSLVNDVDVNTIPIHFVEYQDSQSWQTIMQDEANTILPQAKYLWRATLLSSEDKAKPSHHIILTVHHSIYDGLSSVALFDALLQYFSNPSIQATPFLIPNPIETLFVHTAKEDKNIISNLEALDKIERYQWEHQNPTPFERRETHFKFIAFSPSQRQKIQDSAKQKSVTVNSVLNAAMLLSAQKMLKKTYNAGLSTPVSLRSMTDNKTTEQDMAFLCTVINTVHPNISAETSFWDLAASYQQQLKERFEVLSLQSKPCNFTELEQSLKFLWDPNRDHFCYDFMVTNLGMVHFKNESSNYRVKALRFGTCRAAGDNNMMLLVNSTRDGMFLTFGYCHPLITDEWATRFIEQFNEVVTTPE